MIRIEKENYIMDVDVEKTREYYKNIELCDCDNCCNYYEAIKDRLPKLNEFLSEFGVDIRRPDEMGSYDDAPKQCVNYYFVITVYNIVLPWVLDKPLEPLVAEKKEKGGFLKKLLKF